VCPFGLPDEAAAAVLVERFEDTERERAAERAVAAATAMGG